MKELLSVVIITCNRHDCIIQSIESCIAHSARPLEFVIVDNASTDNTKELLYEFFEGKENTTLNYTYLDKNTGVSYARNIGYQKATGDILFFIDDDAVVISETNSLDVVSDYMRKHDNVAACMGKSIDPRYGGAMQMVRDKKDLNKDYYTVRSYIGFNHFIKKGFSSRDYLYPYNLFYGSEELYVGLTVIALGLKEVYIDSHIVEHHPSTQTRIDPREGIKNGHINTYVIKSYFSPNIFSAVSYTLFLFRILRFCRFNIKEVLNCLSLVRQRRDSQYNCKMSTRRYVDAIQRFGFFKIV